MSALNSQFVQKSVGDNVDNLKFKYVNILRTFYLKRNFLICKQKSPPNRSFSLFIFIKRRYSMGNKYIYSTFISFTLVKLNRPGFNNVDNLIFTFVDMLKIFYLKRNFLVCEQEPPPNRSLIPIPFYQEKTRYG